ncbi:MAG: anthranilate phosphoribosyltransferase [Candidatus Glassbacteria bacterium]|nr:anthranilate phosphoribosyltransferase [Candidatus Glassbacteria bacterium]
METLVEFIRLAVEGRDLSDEQAERAMQLIMEGRALPSQIASLLTALRIKGETVGEITAFARVMRDKVTPVKSQAHSSVLDTCGTGGDGSGSFNISTAAAFVAAGAGVPVAKHGNRSVSSRCGSADVLKELGVNLEAGPDTVARCLDQAGICFIFAPLFHPAMKHAIGPRREIGIRTVFNILGPLTNPAGAECQLLGVYDPELCRTLAEVLQRLGSRRAYVVHGHGGLDEAALSGPTRVAELKGGEIRCHEISPADFGLETHPVEAVLGGDDARNAQIMRELFAGGKGPYRDIVCLNAGLAISAYDEGLTIGQAVEKAARALDDGLAAEKLERLAALSNLKE